MKSLVRWVLVSLLKSNISIDTLNSCELVNVLLNHSRTWMWRLFKSLILHLQRTMIIPTPYIIAPFVSVLKHHVAWQSAVHPYNCGQREHDLWTPLIKTICRSDDKNQWKTGIRATEVSEERSNSRSVPIRHNWWTLWSISMGDDSINKIVVTNIGISFAIIIMCSRVIDLDV